MKKIALIAWLMAMLCMNANAQEVPDGASLRYYSETKGTNNGLYGVRFTIYEQAGKYYLRRTRSFAGMQEPVRNKEDKIRQLPDVTFELSKSEVRKICDGLRTSQLDALGKSCMEEEQINGPSEHSGLFVWGVNGPKTWRQVIEWPGVLTGVSTGGTIVTSDYTDGKHTQRNIYLRAFDAMNNIIEDIGHRYVKKNIKRLWREFYGE